MADQESVLSDLLMKFRVDEASITEALSRERQFTTDRNLLHEAQKAGLENLAAAEENLRQENLKSLANLEALTRRHYAERVKAAQDNAGELLRIEEQLTRDLERIHLQRERVSQPPTQPEPPPERPYDPKSLDDAFRGKVSPGMLSLDALRDVNKEKALKDLDEIELQVTRYYDNRKKKAGDNADELLRIEEQSARDFARIQKTRESIESGESGASPTSAAMSIQSILSRDLRSILGSLGLPLLAGFSFAGFITEMSQALNRIRAIEAASTAVSRSAGQFDPGYGRILASGLRELTLESGRPFNELTRVASTFAPYLPPTSPNDPGASGANLATELTRQVLGLGTTYAVREETVGNVMKMFHELGNIPLDETAEAFKNAADKALEFGRPVEDFMKDLVQLTELNRRYGGGINENIQMLSLFSKELHYGVVTVQDLNRLQFGLARADEGSRAFYVGQALERGFIGGPAADLLSRVASNPAALEYMAAGIIEDAKNPMGNEVRRGVAMMAREIAGSMVTGADSQEVRDAVINKITDSILQSVGMLSPDTPQKQRRALEEAMLGERRPSSGPVTSSGAPGSMEQLVTQGIEMMKQAQPWQNEIKTRLEMIYEGLVMGFDKIARPDYYKKGQPGYEADVEITAGQIRGLMESAGSDSTRVGYLKQTLSGRATRDIVQFIDVMDRLGYGIDTSPGSAAKTVGGRTVVDNFEYDALLKQRARDMIDKIVIEVHDATKSGTSVKVPGASGSRPPAIQSRVAGN